MTQPPNSNAPASAATDEEREKLVGIIRIWHGQHWGERFADAILAAGFRLAPSTPAPVEADANLTALLRYSGGFYTVAIESGMRKAFAADAVAHIEKAARRLHALATDVASPSSPTPADPIQARAQGMEEAARIVRGLRDKIISGYSEMGDERRNAYGNAEWAIRAAISRQSEQEPSR